MSGKEARPVYVFKIPEKLSAAVGIKQLGMVALTGEEELAAFARGKKDNAKLAAELAKTSLVECDGKPLSLGDGSVDTFWKTSDPRIRHLITTAYTKIHAVEDDDESDFLSSQEVRLA